MSTGKVLPTVAITVNGDEDVGWHDKQRGSGVHHHSNVVRVSRYLRTSGSAAARVYVHSVNQCVAGAAQYAQSDCLLNDPYLTYCGRASAKGLQSTFQSAASFVQQWRASMTTTPHAIVHFTGHGTTASVAGYQRDVGAVGFEAEKKPGVKDSGLYLATQLKEDFRPLVERAQTQTALIMDQCHAGAFFAPLSSNDNLAFASASCGSQLTYCESCVESFWSNNVENLDQKSGTSFWERFQASASEYFRTGVSIPLFYMGEGYHDMSIEGQPAGPMTRAPLLWAHSRDELLEELTTMKPGMWTAVLFVETLPPDYHGDFLETLRREIPGGESLTDKDLKESVWYPMHPAARWLDRWHELHQQHGHRMHFIVVEGAGEEFGIDATTTPGIRMFRYADVEGIPLDINKNTFLSYRQIQDVMKEYVDVSSADTKRIQLLGGVDFGLLGRRNPSRNSLESLLHYDPKIKTKIASIDWGATWELENERSGVMSRLRQIYAELDAYKRKYPTKTSDYIEELKQRSTVLERTLFEFIRRKDPANLTEGEKQLRWQLRVQTARSLYEINRGRPSQIHRYDDFLLPFLKRVASNTKMPEGVRIDAKIAIEIAGS